MREQVALITGASSGIGKAAAEVLARRGFRVFAGVRRPMAGDTPRADGITAVPLDVTSDEGVSAAIQMVLEQAGRIDVLVNNAGYGQYGSVEDLALADAQRQFDVNVFGLMRVTRAVLPAMRRQGAGRIVMISSVAGRLSTPFAGWYSASKHAVEALSDALRLELSPFGIQVTVVQPAAIKTSFDDVALDELARTTRTEAYQPMAAAFRRLVEGSYARAPGPEVVAAAVLRAATARRAPIRIAVPGEARVMLLLKRLLGDRLFDSLVGAQLRPSPGAQGPHGDSSRPAGRRA
jgi:NAD(P)-dependent dehydrogenase (short-subunit alcohol dehydrogenase family)